LGVKLGLVLYKIMDRRNFRMRCHRKSLYSSWHYCFLLTRVTYLTTL